jgi:prefoldin subunit 1
MVDARSRLQMTEMQMRTRQIEVKKNDLATVELGKLADDSRMFRGIGRMFMLETKADTVGRMTSESEVAKAASETLTKEKAYLQKQYKQSEESLRELLRNR